MLDTACSCLRTGKYKINFLLAKQGRQFSDDLLKTRLYLDGAWRIHATVVARYSRLDVSWNR